MKNKKQSLEKLHQAAVQTRNHAYSPYSNYKIGAALYIEGTKNIFTGCNVENASYGGTICAERTAVFNAVSKHGKIKISDICVVSDSKNPWPPCGFCRQVIAEFATAKTQIHIADLKGIKKTFTLNDLLPEAFSPANLTKL